MSLMTTVNLEERLKDLHRYIREGRHIEALNEFYDRAITMQENANPPTVGLEANIEREKQFFKTVKEWKGFEVKSFAIGDGVTFYEAVVDFIAMNGQSVHSEQVVVARWRNGKIVHERFFYDTGRAKD
ncbi:MAG TPA: ester cyclase [Nitrospira sp.]|nr:ester cyclase [Nitrospira sp.]